MKHYNDIEVVVMDAPYTCKGRGCIRITLIRDQKQMELDCVKKARSNNLIWWRYNEPTPVYKRSSVDEDLPLSIILHCFEVALGVTKENHLDYAMKAGKFFRIKPGDIVNINSGPVVSKFNGR